MPVMGGVFRSLSRLARVGFVESVQGHFASWFEGGSFSHSELARLGGCWVGCVYCTVHVLRLALLLSFRRCCSGVIPFLGLSDWVLGYSACQVTNQ